jgi:hypothetical protein
MVTTEQIRQRLRYNPTTGVFTLTGGRRVGFPSVNGYTRVSVGGQTFMAHRVAWLLVHGAWPDGEIDHINGVRDDNRIVNLRDVDHAGNQQNLKRAQRNNKSGLLGVSFEQWTGRWKAQIMHRRRNMNLGRFDTKEEAHAAYLVAKRILHAASTL